MEDVQHGLVYRASSRIGEKPVLRLTEGGRAVANYNPVYLPAVSVPGYSGHCPGYNFRVGKTHSANFGVFENEQREETFRNGFRLKPGMLSSYCRKPMRYLHQGSSARLSKVDYGRYQRMFSFYEQTQDHRDTYRDVTGTLENVKKFQIPKRNREAWKPQFPMDSYYLHHNRKPDSKVNYFDRFHPSRLYAPRPPRNYDPNPLTHLLHGTQ